MKKSLYLIVFLLVVVTISFAKDDAKISIKKYPFGFTCFKIVGDTGTIITDPYAMNEDVYPDIVTESHQHEDHSDISRIKGKYNLITDTGVFEIGGIKITGIAGAHDNTMYPLGDNKNNIYIFDINGIRIAEFGSQGKLPNEKMFSEMGKIDILIIQYFRYGGYKIGEKELVEILKRIKPKIVIPAHGESSFTYDFTKTNGGSVIKIDNGELEVTSKQINEINETIFYIMDN